MTRFVPLFLLLSWALPAWAQSEGPKLASLATRASGRSSSLHLSVDDAMKSMLHAGARDGRLPPSAALPAWRTDDEQGVLSVCSYGVSNSGAGASFVVTRLQSRSLSVFLENHGSGLQRAQISVGSWVLLDDQDTTLILKPGIMAADPRATGYPVQPALRAGASLLFHSGDLMVIHNTFAGQGREHTTLATLHLNPWLGVQGLNYSMTGVGSNTYVGPALYLAPNTTFWYGVNTNAHNSARMLNFSSTFEY